MRNTRAGLRDMALSLAVLLVPVVLIAWFFTRTPAPTITAVDWRPELIRARAQSPYPVLAPANLPSGWTPTRIGWARAGEQWLQGTATGNTWTIGYLSPDKIYLAVDQADGPRLSFISATTRQGSADGTSNLGGLRWTRMLSQDGRTRALVNPQAKVTTIVVGDTTYAALEAFAQSLSAS